MTELSEPAAAQPTAPAPASPTAVERRIVTVLFADLVGFTTLSERLDPEDVAAIQDAYFGAVRDTIARYGGVLEKFIGDAAMAVFGAPRARDDDAERAVRAGLALVGAVEQLSARLGLEPGSLQVRVGVNSGEVVHATAGPDAGRVTGDTVNTAARLQTAARPNSVLVGEITALAVAREVELADVDPLQLKGKAESVHAREALAARPHVQREEALGGLRAPLLGRADELARLEATLDGAGGHRVVIVAPPGVGKSRLVAELAERAQARGVRVLRARVRPHATSPYEPVAQLLAEAGAEAGLRDALAATPLTAARRAFVADEVDGLLRPAEAGKATAVKDIAAERDARFAAWSEALAALAGDVPVLWIVEDVHWAGPDLLAFLDHAATEPTAARRLVLATARPSILETAPDWVDDADVLELATLPAVDAAGLVGALVGDAIPAPLRDAIAERSDGNPLFIEELLRTWISVGTLVRDPGGADEHDGVAAPRWRLAVDPGDVTLPATVQAIYAAQLDDLPPDARLVARRASVAGRRFADAALEPLELQDRRPGLDVLRRRAFVAGPQADPFAGDVYAYRHALLRDAGYASLARVERARLHVALARWLEDAAGRGDGATAAAQLVAEHYAAALDSLPAIAGHDDDLRRDRLEPAAAHWFERAAEASIAVAAHEEAVRLLQRSIEHTDPEAAIDRARRRLRLGEIVADAADLDVGIGEMTAALETSEAHLPGAAGLYADAAHRLAKAYMQQIRFVEAEQTTARALERIPHDVNRAAVARLTGLHAWAVSAQGRKDGVLDEIERARAIARELDDPILEIDVLEYYATVHDEVEERRDESWGELEALATRHGRWRQAAIASRIRGILLADTDPKAALAILDESAEVARTHGLTEQQGWADLARCETLWVLGDWDAALAAGDRAIALGERYAYLRLVFRTWMVVLPLLAARRDPSWEARHLAWWAQAEPHFPPSPSPYGVALRAATALWLPLARGEPADALPLPDPALARDLPPFGNPHFVATLELLAEHWLAGGERAAADAVATVLRDAAPDPGGTPLMRAASALLDARLAAADGDSARAATLAARALDESRSIDAVWWELRARRQLGEDVEALERRLGIPH